MLTQMPEAMLGTIIYLLPSDFLRQGHSLNGENFTRLPGWHVRGPAYLCLPSGRVTETHDYAGDLSSDAPVSRTDTLSAEPSPLPHSVILLKSRDL